MKANFHSLIPFLPLFCNCQFRRIDSIQFLCSRVHILTGWRLETQLTLLKQTLLYNNFARTKQKTQPHYCWEGFFTASLHSNRSYSIFVCLFVAAGMDSLSRCPAMNVCSDITAPVSERHVTIWTYEIRSICETAFIFHSTLLLRWLQTAVSKLERKYFPHDVYKSKSKVVFVSSQLIITSLRCMGGGFSSCIHSKRKILLLLPNIVPRYNTLSGSDKNIEK
jgi:hypothetical protein